MPKILRKVLGLTLLIATVGVATCQSMFEAAQFDTDAPSTQSVGK